MLKSLAFVAAFAAAADDQGIAFSEPDKKLSRLDRMDERVSNNGSISSRRNDMSNRSNNLYDSQYSDYHRGSYGDMRGGMGSGMYGGENMHYRRGGLYDRFQSLYDSPVEKELMQLNRGVVPYSGRVGPVGGYGVPYTSGIPLAGSHGVLRGAGIPLGSPSGSIGIPISNQAYGRVMPPATMAGGRRGYGNGRAFLSEVPRGWKTLNDDMYDLYDEDDDDELREEEVEFEYPGSGQFEQQADRMSMRSWPTRWDRPSQYEPRSMAPPMMEMAPFGMRMMHHDFNSLRRADGLRGAAEGFAPQYENRMMKPF